MSYTGDALLTQVGWHIHLRRAKLFCRYPKYEGQGAPDRQRLRDWSSAKYRNDTGNVPSQI